MKIKIDEIVVGSRARVDLGNIEELANSIKENGLLQPIAVDTEGFLIDGQRRIEAAKLLGWTDIEAHRLTVNDILKAEYDANEMRKSFTPSERVELAKRIEQWVKAKAQDRIKEAGKYGYLGGRGHKNPPGEIDSGVSEKRIESRNVIAKMVGTSADTLKKAKEIVESAQSDPQNKDLVEKMDQTGKVSPSYEELKKRIESKKVNESNIGIINEYLDNNKKSKVVPVVFMPNGDKETLSHLTSDRFMSGNVMRWIAENSDLTDGCDILIKRRGNIVELYKYQDLSLPFDVKLVSEGIGQKRNELFLDAIKRIREQRLMDVL